MSGQYRQDILLPPGANISLSLKRAMMRAAAIAHRQLSQGLNSLATIASLAFWVGILGTLAGIFGAFRGGSSSREAVMAAISAELSKACVPAAAGLLIAIFALSSYKYLTGRLECFDREMENASVELTNLLGLRLKPLRASAGAISVPVTPTFRDEFGDELREDRRPWYRSRLLIGLLLVFSWGVQTVRYLDNDELPLVSAIPRAVAYVIFVFAVTWFTAYPVWLKALHRKSGVLVVLASSVCLSWSLIELLFRVHLW